MDKKQKKKLIIGISATGAVLVGLFSNLVLEEKLTDTLRTEKKEAEIKKANISFYNSREKQESSPSSNHKSEEAISYLYDRAGLDQVTNNELTLTYQELQEISDTARNKTQYVTTIHQVSKSEPSNGTVFQLQGSTSKEKSEAPLESPILPPIKPEVDSGPTPIPVIVINYQALQEVLITASTFLDEAYLTSSYQKLQTEMEIGQRMLAKLTSTQAEVETQVIRIRQAIQGLIPKGDRTELVKCLKQGQKINLELYTTVSVNKFKQVYSQALTTVNLKEAPQEIFDQQVFQLNQAITNLVGRGEKTALKDLIFQIKQIDREIYTVESLQLLDDVVSESQAILSDRNATQSRIDQTLFTLRQRYERLVKVNEPHLSLIYLKRLIAECEQLKAEEYTPTLFEHFLLALNQAIELVNSSDITTNQIQEQLLFLQQAKEQLIKKADKSILLQLITESVQIQEEDYTPESWVVLQNTFIHAKAVLVNDEVSQKEVDETVTELETAMAALVLLPKEQHYVSGLE